jgi:hypothetical protein
LTTIVFGDWDVRNLLEGKFYLISEQDWSFSQHDIDRYLMGKQDSPFDALHDDSSLYKNSLYALTDTGLYTSDAHKPKRNTYKVERQAAKLWDGLGTQIQAKSETLAIAAADDGLFELSLATFDDPTPVSDRHTLSVSWAFASVYGSSDLSPGHLAVYRWRQEEVEDEEFLEFPDYPSTKRVREFVRDVDEEEIFGPADYDDSSRGTLSWGGQDKLYRAGAGWIDAVRFVQRYASDPIEDHNPFESIGRITLADGGSHDVGHAIAGGVAYFGLVVEYDDYLVIATSDGGFHNIIGPMTRWRVFPRSIRYENQLHVILDDRIEIYSFNHDYFVEQQSKQAGIEFREFGSGRGWARAGR